MSKCNQKHGCIIVKGGKVLARAVNKNRNHPSICTYGRVKEEAAVHAEVAAINMIKDKSILRGAIIFVARKSKTGTPALSKPCTNCADYIATYGIKRIIYT